MTRRLLRICTVFAFALHLVACVPGAEARPGANEETITDCRVVDGDTLRCGAERVRLLAIDAPELPGHCRRGRNCAPGDPAASTNALQTALTGRLTILRVGTDRYGRTLAAVSANGRDLSCRQLRAGQALYRGDWDNGGIIASRCPNEAR